MSEKKENGVFQKMLQRISEKIKQKQFMLKFESDFKNLDALTQFKKYLDLQNIKHETQADWNSIHLSLTLLMPYTEISMFAKRKKYAMQNASENIDIVKDFANNFNVNPAIARYSLRCAEKIFNNKQIKNYNLDCEKSNL